MPVRVVLISNSGIIGYSVFSNLYLSSGALLFVGEPESNALPDEGLGETSPSLRTMPATRQIMSGPKPAQGGYKAADEERWRVVEEELAQGELGKRAIELKGTTVSGPYCSDERG